MPDATRDHIDELVDWQLKQREGRHMHMPPAPPPEQEPPTQQPHRPGLLGLVRDAITGTLQLARGGNHG